MRAVAPGPVVVDAGPPLAKLSPYEPDIDPRDDGRTESPLSVSAWFCLLD